MSEQVAIALLGHSFSYLTGQYEENADLKTCT